MADQKGDSPRSLGGREMADHVHDDDGGAVHGREGRGHGDQDEGGLVGHNLSQSNVDVAGIQATSGENSPQGSGPVKTFVGGTKSVLREDPTDAGTRNVRRRLVVPKGMRKMNVADEDGENKGT